MKNMKQALLKIAEGVPQQILRKILVRKMKETNLSLPEPVLNALIEHIMSRNTESFIWNDGLGDENVRIKLTFTKDDGREIEESFSKVVEALPKALLEGLKAGAGEIFESLCERWEVEDLTQRNELEGFRERLEQRWRDGLAFLRMLLTCCREIGRNTSVRHAKSKSQKHKFRRWVLVRLHTRACQITDEIICLLQNGFADGAMARWRTLYEISVVGILIAEGDEELAERYMLHDVVEVKRQADTFDKQQAALGLPALSKLQRAMLEKQYNQVLSRFGFEFAHPYGWAAKHLHLKKPTFKELQEAADRAGLSSHYKLASFNVHASARSLFFNLCSIGPQPPLVAGRSNAGLDEPGARTAHTITLITALYAGNSPDLKRLIETNTLLRLRDEAIQAFERTAWQLEQEVRAPKKPRQKSTAKS